MRRRVDRKFTNSISSRKTRSVRAGGGRLNRAGDEVDCRTLERATSADGLGAKEGKIVGVTAWSYLVQEAMATALDNADHARGPNPGRRHHDIPYTKLSEPCLRDCR